MPCQNIFNSSKKVKPLFCSSSLLEYAALLGGLLLFKVS